jgi:hypothetical protein
VSDRTDLSRWPAFPNPVVLEYLKAGAWRGGRDEMKAAERPLVLVPDSGEAERRESGWPTQTMNSYIWATVHGAVRRYAHRNTRNEIADKTALTPADATRVRRLYKHDLLRLNAQGKLEVDPRVRQKGNRIWLRYWDEKLGRWLDPKDSLP